MQKATQTIAQSQTLCILVNFYTIKMVILKPFTAKYNAMHLSTIKKNKTKQNWVATRETISFICSFMTHVSFCLHFVLFLINKQPFLLSF